MASEAGIGNINGEPASRSVRSTGADAQRQRWLLFWFYVGVPLAIGFLLGWLQVGRSVDWPRSVSLLYWLGVGVVMTPLNALGTALLAPLLRRLHSPLWLTLFFGQILAGFVLTNPVLHGWRAWLQANVYPQLVLTPATSMAEFLQRLPSNSVMWMGITLLFFHGLRMPLFGYRPAPRAGTDATPMADAAEASGAATEAATAGIGARPARLALLERVRPDRRGALLAIKAEGHYLQVYTDAGSDLVLYRLSDALLELGSEDGRQVHRSWWVASRALAPQRHRDKLVLTNGVEVPVSRSFLVAARQRGWLTPGDTRD